MVSRRVQAIPPFLNPSDDVGECYVCKASHIPRDMSYRVHDKHLCSISEMARGGTTGYAMIVNWENE